MRVSKSAMLETPKALDPSKIDDHFPYPEYREGQKRTIEKIVSSFNNKRVCILEAPTGSGKA